MELQSYTGLDRVTPTPQQCYGRPPHQGPHGHLMSEMELCPAGVGAYSNHDRPAERIRIPSSNSVNNKSGSVEIGTLVCIDVTVSK